MCERHIQHTLLVNTAITKAALQAVEGVIRTVGWKIAQELEFRDMGTGEQTTGTLLIQITYQTCTSLDESSSYTGLEECCTNTSSPLFIL